MLSNGGRRRYPEEAAAWPEWKIDRRFELIDRRFEAVDQRLDALDSKMSRQFVWLVGIQVTTLLAVAGGFAAVAGGFASVAAAIAAR